MLDLLRLNTKRASIQVVLKTFVSAINKVRGSLQHQPWLWLVRQADRRSIALSRKLNGNNHVLH